MNDRLAELVRQRALVQEHLAWLDQQLADAKRTSNDFPAEPSGSARDASLPTLPSLPPLPDIGTSSHVGEKTIAPSTSATKERSPEADDMLEQFRVTPDAVKNDVRKGCFLYFGLAFLLLGLGVTALYFALRPR